MPATVPGETRPFFATALVTQIASGLLAAIATDGGVLLKIWYAAMISYWVPGGLLLAFSAHTKKPFVRPFLRWGFLVLLITVAPFLSAAWWGSPYPGGR